MTAELLEQAAARLARKLSLDAQAAEDEAVTLQDALLEAEWELLLYLGTDELEERFLTKAVELAALLWRRDRREEASAGLKSASYAEGQVSQSESYLSPAEFRAGVAEVLESLARYRRVTC